MSKKHHGGPGPVPPGNKSHSGPKFNDGPPDEEQAEQKGPEGTSGAAAQEQDAKRRLGDFVGAGEQSIKQPGGKNDANH